MRRHRLDDSKLPFQRMAQATADLGVLSMAYSGLVGRLRFHSRTDNFGFGAAWWSDSLCVHDII